MDFSAERAASVDGVQTIALEGQLDAHSYHVLKDQLASLLAESKAQIVLDCKGLEYISSAGLGVLKQMRKEFKEAGGDLYLAAVPGKIDNILNLLGFSKIIRVFPTNDEAVASFQSSSDS